MKKPMFENYAQTNESMCNGCLCRAACSDRVRARNKSLVACGCELQKLMREWVQKLEVLEPAEALNLPQLASCHFGDVYSKTIDKVIADDKNFVGDTAQSFRRLLLCELNTLQNILLQFAER